MNTAPIMIHCADASRKGGNDSIMLSTARAKQLAYRRQSGGIIASHCHDKAQCRPRRQQSPRSAVDFEVPSAAQQKYQEEDKTSRTEEEEREQKSTALSPPVCAIPDSYTSQQPPKPVWVCTCNAENDGNHNFCCLCGEPKFWACVACKFSENRCTFNFCGMCGISRTVRKEDLPSDDEDDEDEATVIRDNEWKCQGCDQINACPNIFCTMCGSSKLEDKSEQSVHASFPLPYILVDEQDENDLEIHHVSVNSLLFDDSMEWWSDEDEGEEDEED